MGTLIVPAAQRTACLLEVGGEAEAAEVGAAVERVRGREVAG